MQQVQALYLLHAASPDSCQPLLVAIAAEEAAPAAVRVLAFRLLADNNGKQLRSLTAWQFVQQSNGAELKGAPTLAELKQQFAGSGLEGPQACWAAEADAAAMPTLPSAQLVAVGLLQSLEGRSDLDADTRQRIAILRTALQLWFGAQQVKRIWLWRQVEGQQQELEQQDEGQQQGQQDHQGYQELASHPLSLPASPQLMVGPAAEPSKPVSPTQQQQQQQRAEASRASSMIMHEPNEDCASMLLLQEALCQPLVPAEQQQLLLTLLAAGAASPLLQALWCTSRDAFAGLVQHNPLVAAETVATAVRLGQLHAAERFLAAVAEAPLGPQSMECMSVVAATGLAPDDALRAFAARCIGAADACAEPGRQGRLVKLLCAFVGLLLRHAPSAVLGMQEELAAFCIQHSRHVPAAELYRRLMALAGADSGVSD